MDTSNKLHQVAVIGACGKMGRGIALLLLQEMALLACASDPSAFHLRLIDSNAAAFFDLKGYLRQQLLKFAEKNINRLRQIPSDCVSNREVIQGYVERALMIANCSTAIESVKGSHLIFEAAFEDVSLKGALLKQVSQEAKGALVFTNTSSIPIGQLASVSGLGNALIGYHFYNPPAVQKLLEIIPSKKTSKELIEFSTALGKRLGKTMVFSSDVAGFIGNGHFAKEMEAACSLVEALALERPFEEAVELVDGVTRDYLLRPMGIFQLLDYVGLPIALQILEIMQLNAPLINKWVQAGLMGGQTAQGGQKNGIFSYEGGEIKGVFSLQQKQYIPIKHLSSPQELSWKSIQKNSALAAEIPRYFQELKAKGSEKEKLAIQFLKQSQEICAQLVSNHVADSSKDVELVLKNGFFHLYSPMEVVP